MPETPRALYGDVYVQPSSDLSSSLHSRETGELDNIAAHSGSGHMSRPPVSRYESHSYRRYTSAPYPHHFSSRSYDHYHHSLPTYAGPPPSCYGDYGRSQRQLISCYPCRARKLKCDGKEPCQQCDRRGPQVECAYADKVKRRGKGRKYEDGKSCDGKAYESGSGNISPMDARRDRYLSQGVDDGESLGGEDEGDGQPYWKGDLYTIKRKEIR
jgi:hypothetical protein